MFCFTFLFIFTPTALFPFANLHLLTFVSLVFLFSKYLKSFLSIIKLPEVLIFVSLHLAIILYSLILDTFTSFTSQHYKQYVTAFLSARTVIEILPCAIFISIFFLAKKKDTIYFLNFILAVGVLQVFCVIASLLLPDLRSWIMENQGGQNVYDVYDAVKSFRMFGLASGYTYAMPLFLGLCVIISYGIGTYYSSKYYYLIPFYLFSIAVNARIALISLMIAPAVVLALQFKNQFLKQTCNIVFILLVTLCLVQVVKYNAENSSTFNAWVWLYSGIEEFVSFKGGEATGNLESLTDTMWFMPKGVNLLFGTGENVFGLYSLSSDIGYVINLYYGGVVFSLFLYASYTVFIFLCIGKTPIEKYLKYSILIYLYFANLKGNAFNPSDLTFGVILISLFALIYNKQLRNKIIL